MTARPLGYTVRVGGHLDGHWSDRFGRFALTHESDGTTVLSGHVTDQAELHGLLAGIRDLGLTLISVTAHPARDVRSTAEDGRA